MAFNVKKGWPPKDAAIEDSVKPKLSEAIIAGMLVKIDSNGELVKSDGTADEIALFALDSQAARDVQEADKLPVLYGPAIVQTDQFIAGSYVKGATNLEVDATQKGYVKVHSGGAAPKVGRFLRTVTVDGVSMIEYFKPVPFTP